MLRTLGRVVPVSSSAPSARADAPPAQAVDAARRALALAERDGNPLLMAGIRERLAGYQAGRPFRQPTSRRIR